MSDDDDDDDNTENMILHHLTPDIDIILCHKGSYETWQIFRVCVCVCLSDSLAQILHVCDKVHGLLALVRLQQDTHNYITDPVS